MSPARHSAAEDTQTVLQEAVRSGLPIMIPGAFEARVGRPTVSSADGTPHVTPRVSRSAVPRRTILERMWRYIMRPTDTPPS